MPVTIYDVAKKAGVGIGTVSRAINNSPQITEETKYKVLSVIRELDYRPHTVAQSLARRRTSTIGCIIPFFTGYFYMELLRGIQRKVTDHKNDLILYSVDQMEKRDTFLERVLQERRVDGILLVSLEISDEYAQKFKSQGFPIVLLDGSHPELDSIKVDNAEGAFVATKHLLHLGYQSVAMIAGRLTSLPARLRFEGYKKAMADAGVPFDKRFFVATEGPDDNDGFNKENGYAAMQRLLDLGESRPRAVFASSDIQAIGAMQAVRERGLNVPSDVAIVGFDGIELASHVGLTTMRQPMAEMGQIAVDRLMQKIDESDESDFKRKVSTELAIRESCGANKIELRSYS